MSTDIYTISLEEIETIRSSQKKLCPWLYEQGCASWSRIHKACINIVESLSDDKKKFFGNYPEYKIFVPLLRNGTIEVCKQEKNNVLRYCMNENLKINCEEALHLTKKYPWFSKYSLNEPDFNDNPNGETCKVFDAYGFLKSYPSIRVQIAYFQLADIELKNFNFYMNLYDYSYKKCMDAVSQTGIYKTDDVVWYSPFLLDEKNDVHKIPDYDENPDALNLARLYVRITNTSFSKPLFEYSKGKKELKCYYYSELPILFTRALLLFSPEQIAKTQFCLPTPDVPFKNISIEAVKEIERIFAKKSIKYI